MDRYTEVFLRGIMVGASGSVIIMLLVYMFY